MITSVKKREQNREHAVTHKVFICFGSHHLCSKVKDYVDIWGSEQHVEYFHFISAVLTLSSVCSNMCRIDWMYKHGASIKTQGEATLNWKRQRSEKKKPCSLCDLTVAVIIRKQFAPSHWNCSIMKKRLFQFNKSPVKLFELLFIKLHSCSWDLLLLTTSGSQMFVVGADKQGVLCQLVKLYKNKICLFWKTDYCIVWFIGIIHRGWKYIVS